MKRFGLELVGSIFFLCVNLSTSFATDSDAILILEKGDSAQFVQQHEGKLYEVDAKIGATPIDEENAILYTVKRGREGENEAFFDLGDKGLHHVKVGERKEIVSASTNERFLISGSGVMYRIVSKKNLVKEVNLFVPYNEYDRFEWNNRYVVNPCLQNSVYGQCCQQPDLIFSGTSQAQYLQRHLMGPNQFENHSQFEKRSAGNLIFGSDFTRKWLKPRGYTTLSKSVELQEQVRRRNLELSLMLWELQMRQQFSTLSDQGSSTK